MKKLLVLLILLGVIGYPLEAKVYAVVVGVERYDGTVTNLQSAVDDAEKMYRFLLRSNPAENIILLKDNRATKQNILYAMEIFKKARPEDLILFYFSGHGAPNFFCPSNISGGKMALWHTEIKNAFRKSKARAKLCIADACYSGSIRSRRAKPSGNAQTNDGNNVIVFMSSRKDETSVESRQRQAGLFTYYLLRGLEGQADRDRNRQITAYELYGYVRQQVKLASGSQQTPVMVGNFDRHLVISTY